VFSSGLLFNPFVLNGACGCAFNLRSADLRKLSLLATQETSTYGQLCGKTYQTGRIDHCKGSTVFLDRTEKGATIVAAPIASGLDWISINPSPVSPSPSDPSADPDILPYHPSFRSVDY
jgi:hypothetical protein